MLGRQVYAGCHFGDNLFCICVGSFSCEVQHSGQARSRIPTTIMYFLMAVPPFPYDKPDLANTGRKMNKNEESIQA
jgi:hypothetical protein